MLDIISSNLNNKEINDKVARIDDLLDILENISNNETLNFSHLNLINKLYKEAIADFEKTGLGHFEGILYEMQFKAESDLIKNTNQLFNSHQESDYQKKNNDCLESEIMKHFDDQIIKETIEMSKFVEDCKFDEINIKNSLC